MGTPKLSQSFHGYWFPFVYFSYGFILIKLFFSEVGENDHKFLDSLHELIHSQSYHMLYLQFYIEDKRKLREPLYLDA